MSISASQFTGSIPENYDQGLGPHIFDEFGKELARRVAAEKSSFVLELAAGTGIATRYLRDALPLECELVATDLNQEMLDIAADKFAEIANVSFAPADATDIPYSSESFDVVACQFGVMFFPDKLTAFREARRILVPGGTYIFTTWASWEENPFARVTHDTVKLFFPDDPPQFYKVPFGYADMEKIKSELTEARFENITAEAVTLRQKIDYPRFSRGLIYGNPLYDEIKERGGDPEEMRNAVEVALKLEFGNPGVMPLKAWFVRAVRPLRFVRT